MSEPNLWDIPIKVGDIATLRIGGGIGRHRVEITYVGSRSVKVKDELGRTHRMNRWYVARQLLGWPKKKKKLTKKQQEALERERQQKFEESVISTPMGGQPGYRMRRNRSNY